NSKTRLPRAWRARPHGALGLLRALPASGARTSTNDRRASGPENQVPVPVSKGRCRAILKNRETRLSSRRRPCDCQHLLAPYCSSRPEETLSWAASSRFRAARQARCVRSTGDQLRYPYCLATLSFPAPQALSLKKSSTLSARAGRKFGKRKSLRRSHRSLSGLHHGRQTLAG